MLDALSTKLEIDVLQAIDMDGAFQLAQVHRMPAVVVHQDLLSEAFVLRARRQAAFRIISPIDWPKGEQYGSNKVHGMTRDMLACDGYEIMLTAKTHATEILNEVKVVTDFIKRHFSPGVEIRFVLGTNTRPTEMVQAMCLALKHIPAPAMVRTDLHLKTQQSKASTDAHNSMLQLIRSLTGVPVKICGNIGSVAAAEACPEAARMAVSLQQATDIVDELKRAATERSRLPPPSGGEVVATI